MNEAQARIIRLLEQGKISADEAARLLQALNPPLHPPHKRFCINITRDPEHGTHKVQVDIPIGDITEGLPDDIRVRIVRLLDEALGGKGN